MEAEFRDPHVAMRARAVREHIEDIRTMPDFEEGLAFLIDRLPTMPNAMSSYILTEWDQDRSNDAKTLAAIGLLRFAEKWHGGE